MRLVFKILLGLFLILAVIVVGLHFYVAGGAASYKGQIEAEATKALGRAVTIGEVKSAGLFPNPGFEVTALTIANADGMTDAYFASVGEAGIRVKLLPLIPPSTVEISKFVLDKPEINLEKRADGAVNWMLGADASEPAEKGGAGVAISDISLGKVQLTDGKVTYRDLSSGQTFVAEDADINLTLTSLDKPLSADGRMIFQGEPATLSAKVTTPRALMKNTAASIMLNFAVGDNSVDTNINLAGGELAYTGNLDINAPSLKSLLAVLGMPLKVDNGFNRLKISGDVAGSATQMSFNDAAITFDEIKNDMAGNTNVTFDWGSKRPKVSGEIDLDRLDLRPYLPAPPEQIEANKRDKGAAFPPWPNDQIDFSTLQAVDVDLKATTNGIYLHGMSFGSSGLDLDVKNGVLTAVLTELNLYDGGGSGTLKVDSQQRFPSVSLQNLRLSGMNAQTFATEVLGLNRIRGVGGLEANLTARGTSVADFMRTLTGSGSFDVDEGVVEGIDIGKIVRSANALLQGFQGGNFNVAALNSAIAEARGPASQSQFSNLDSRFRADNGNVLAENILMKGPLYQILGNGTVNLPNQSMNMTFVPTIFETVEDITGRKLNIPLLISGTFNEPKVGFDTQALVRGVVEDKLKGILGGQGIKLDDNLRIEDALKVKAQEELTNRLFGAPETAPEEGAEPQPAEEPSVEEELTGVLLNSIFGGSKAKEEKEADE